MQLLAYMLFKNIGLQ